MARQRQETRRDVSVGSPGNFWGETVVLVGVRKRFKSPPNALAAHSSGMFSEWRQFTVEIILLFTRKCSFEPGRQISASSTDALFWQGSDTTLALSFGLGVLITAVAAVLGQFEHGYCRLVLAARAARSRDSPSCLLSPTFWGEFFFFPRPPDRCPASRLASASALYSGCNFLPSNARCVPLRCRRSMFCARAAYSTGLLVGSGESEACVAVEINAGAFLTSPCTYSTAITKSSSRISVWETGLPEGKPVNCAG